MRIIKKYWMGLGGFFLFGCSVLSRAGQPAATPARSEYPADTKEPAREWTMTSTMTESVTPAPTASPYIMVELTETREDLSSIVLREAQNAETLGRVPYLQIVADWCPACRALKRSMKDERMIDAYRGTYILLADIDIWRDQLPKIGIYVPGVPAIYELTDEGKPTGRSITGAAWGENTPENMAPPLDEFFHPG